MSGLKTILLVENDLVALTMYSDRLAREGFQVETAESGEAALHQLENPQIDLVVLDLMLPNLSGAEVFKRMRANPRLRETPVVIFSNATLPEWPEDVTIGPTRCLHKSDTTFAMLLETIHECLNAAAGIRTPAINPENTTENTTMLTTTALPDAAPAAAPTANGAPPQINRADFLKDAISELPKIREDCFGYIKAPTTASSAQHLATLRDRIESLRTRSAQAQCARLTLLTTPFNTLVSELIAKPGKATPSILQTIAQAVDCLGLVLDSDDAGEGEPMMTPQALVVDDDPVSSQVNVTALQQASFETTSIEDPLTALEILAATPFDIIVLDVNMPNLTGFEVCEKLRRLPQAKTTPVIFLTAFNNFENRKQSVLSGGGDFISKPVSTRELALKATIHLLKAQLRQARATQTASPEAAAPVNGANGSGSTPQRVSSNTLVPGTESATTTNPTAPETAAPTAPAPQLAPAATPANADAWQFAPSHQTDPLFRRATQPSRTPVGPEPIFSPKPPAVHAPSEGVVAAAAVSTVALNEAMASFHKERSTLLERTAAAETELKNIRTQLETATAAATQAQTAQEQKATRCTQLEQEVADLSRRRDELQSQLAATTEAARQAQQKIADLVLNLARTASELQSAKAGLESQSADRSRSESELREHLSAAKLVADQTTAALKEKEEWSQLLEQELTTLKQTRDQLLQQHQSAAAELERAKADLQHQANEHAQTQSALRDELAAAKLAAEQTSARLQEQEQRTRSLEQELSGVQPLRDQLGQLQQQGADELVRVRADFEKQLAERAQSESALRDQLNGSRAALETAEAVLRERTEQMRLQDQELASLRPLRDQHEQHRLESATELDRLKAELEQKNAEHTRTESELRDLLSAARTELQKSGDVLREKEEWFRLLEEELAALRQSHDQLQQQQHQAAEELVRVNTDLEKQSAERSRIESDCRAMIEAKEALTQDLARARETVAAAEAKALDAERQVRDHWDALTRTTSELEQERAQRQQLEQRTATFDARLREWHQHLSEYLSSPPHAQS